MEYLKYYIRMSDAVRCECSYWILSVFVIVPAVVLGGMMPTNAPSMSPRAKLTAARPKTGGAASCQHSRREALLAADMAVMLKLVAWLAAPPTRASTQVVLIEKSFIATI
jgi:hypothetical protein